MPRKASCSRCKRRERVAGISIRYAAVTILTAFLPRRPRTEARRPADTAASDAFIADPNLTHGVSRAHGWRPYACALQHEPVATIAGASGP